MVSNPRFLARFRCAFGAVTTFGIVGVLGLATVGCASDVNRRSSSANEATGDRGEYSLTSASMDARHGRQTGDVYQRLADERADGVEQLEELATKVSGRLAEVEIRAKEVRHEVSAFPVGPERAALDSSLRVYEARRVEIVQKVRALVTTPDGVATDTPAWTETKKDFDNRLEDLEQRVVALETKVLPVFPEE